MWRDIFDLTYIRTKCAVPATAISATEAENNSSSISNTWCSNNKTRSDTNLYWKVSRTLNTDTSKQTRISLITQMILGCSMMVFSVDRIYTYYKHVFSSKCVLVFAVMTYKTCFYYYFTKDRGIRTPFNDIKKIFGFYGLCFFLKESPTQNAQNNFSRFPFLKKKRIYILISQLPFKLKITFQSEVFSILITKIK